MSICVAKVSIVSDTSGRNFKKKDMTQMKLLENTSCRRLNFKGQLTVFDLYKKLGTRKNK